MGAGLGGGSSDAAEMFSLINGFLILHIPAEGTLKIMLWNWEVIVLFLCRLLPALQQDAEKSWSQLHWIFPVIHFC